MKFNIIIGAVFLAISVAMFNAVNITADNISENKAGLSRLHKSFLSLSEEFESVKANTKIIKATSENYRNSLVNLTDRLNAIEETNSEIYRILNDLDERLNRPPVATVVVEKFIEPEVKETEFEGVNAGLGVLTGAHVLGETVVEEAAIVECPKPTARKSFDSYISRIVINRSLSFTALYDVIAGQATNINYDGSVPNNLKRAVNRYISDFKFPGEVTVRGCSLPFTINI
jgi:hypothetical protein